MIDAFNSALSGLRAAGAQAAIAAENIANARSTRPTSAAIDPATAAAYYSPSRAVQTTGAAGQPVVNRVPVDPPYQNVFDPGHPDADSDGLIGVANVNLAANLVELSQAKHAYAANAAVLRTASEMSGTLLDALA